MREGQARAMPLGLVVDRRFLSIPWVRLEPFPAAGPTRAVPRSSDVALRKGQDPLGQRRGAQAMTAPRLLVVSRSLPAKGEPPASFFGSAVAARKSAEAGNGHRAGHLGAYGVEKRRPRMKKPRSMLRGRVRRMPFDGAPSKGRMRAGGA